MNQDDLCHEHYFNLPARLSDAVHLAAGELGVDPLPLDSEVQAFLFRLWHLGYKLVPVTATGHPYPIPEPDPGANLTTSDRPIYQTQTNSAGPTADQLATRVIAVLDQKARGSSNWPWSGMENSDGEEFGSDIEQLIADAKQIISTRQTGPTTDAGRLHHPNTSPPES